MSRYQSPFESVGITPPRGRLGHSVPTPRPLGESLMRQEGQPTAMPKAPVIWCADGPSLVPPASMPQANPPSFAAKGSPAQFYMRRDHNFGGSASRLDRLRAHQELPPRMESFVEVEEDESDELDVLNVTSESPPNKTSADPDLDAGKKKPHRRMSVTLDRFTGDSLLHFSFNPVGSVSSAPDSQLGGSFVTAFSQGLNASFNVPFLHQNNPSSPSPSGDASFLFPSAARNPNKAIVTIDAQTSRILVANEMTCELFGYQRDDLPGMKVQKLFTEPYGAKQQALVEQNIDSSGKTVVVSGKVMDALTSYGMEFPVSVWMKQVRPAPQPRVIVVIEPVERSTAQFSMDGQGTIMSCEPWFAIMFAFSNPSEIMGRSVHEVIPSLQLPTGAARLRELPQSQAVTGRTKDGTAFPITVDFTFVSDGIASAEDLFSPTAANLSPVHTPKVQQSPMHTSEAQHSPMHTPKVQQSPMHTSEAQQSPMHTPKVQQSPMHTSEVQHSPMHTSEAQHSPMHTPEVQQSPIRTPKVLQAEDVDFQRTGSNPFLPLDEQLVTGGPIVDERESVVTDRQQQKSDRNPFDAYDKRFTNGGELCVGVEGKSPTNPLAGGGDKHLHYCIEAKVIVYASLSGMISFLSDGTIHGCNHHFALMLFGYSQQELLKKDITFLIPDFYNHVSYVDDRSMPLPPLEEGDEGEVFHAVLERSISPEKAFEMARPPGHRDPPKPLSPRKAAHLHKSPRRAGRAKPAPPVSQQNLDVGISFTARPLGMSSCDKDASESHQSAADRFEVLSSGKDNRSNGLDALVADLSRMQSGTSPGKFDADADESTHESLSATKDGDLEDSCGSSLQERYLHAHLNAAADESSTRVPNRVTAVEGELDAPLHVSSPAEDETSDVISIGSGRSESVESENERSASMEEIRRGKRGAFSPEEEEDNDARPVSSMSAPPTFGDEEDLPDTASMEVLLELLKERERGMGSGNGTPAKGGGGMEPGPGSRKEPRSSTPASLSSDLSRKEGDPGVVAPQDDFDADSVTSLASLPEGTFLGEARHKDGSLLAIIFQLKCIALAGGESVFCMWISRDLDYERARNADLSASMNRPLPDPYRADQIISPEVGMPSSTRTADPASSQQQLEEILAMEGEYCKSYDTLRPVGKGAFGFVRMAQRKEDGDMVVVKFLRKSSVLRDCWVDDKQMGHIPLEISLLARIAHPNIVQLLEAYENQHYFQMVMEKHGDGLDLFEFIERNPKLSEQLISYMFRQVVAALAYLHQRNILHRDIKDENIILDHRFHLKLIDFGSAAYMAPGKLFNTFCGTLEYCSPEVLLGNSYSGPELEMWALGVTLYTLIFSENPFFDIEETISGHLQPPFLTSPALMKLIFWLLHPDPASRATLKDLQRDKWVNQPIDISEYSFEAVLGCAPPSGTVAVPPKTNEKLKSESENLESGDSKVPAIEETADM